jgi:hypothetical protein
MGKQIILLVHGMGDNKPNWSKSIQTKIKELYSQYTTLNAKYPFDIWFQFKEINYNEIFEEIRTRWNQDSTNILQEMKDTQSPLDTGLIQEIKKMGSSNDFAYTYIMDMIFYRFHSQIRDRVKIRVAKQILTTIQNNVPWFIIAHSMGTTVIHDALDAFYRSPVPGIDSSSIIADNPAKLIMMISNTSKLLKTDVNPYQSVVKPSFSASCAACENYFTVCHNLDIIGMTDPFDPPADWLDDDTKKYNCYQSIPVNHLLAKYLKKNLLNLHSMEHYLENPKVHIPLFKTLIDEDLISTSEETSHQAKFEEHNDTNKLNELAQDFNKILHGSCLNSVDILDRISKFYNKLNDLYKSYSS